MSAIVKTALAASAVCFAGTTSQILLSGCSMENTQCSQHYATEIEALNAVSIFFNGGSSVAGSLLSRIRDEGASDATLAYLTAKPRCPVCPAFETRDANGRQVWLISISLRPPETGPLLWLELTCDGKVHFREVHRSG